MEKIPAFLTPRPTTVDEDPSPYVVQWGLLNKDTIVGDARATTEWFKNMVTPGIGPTWWNPQKIFRSRC